MLNGWLVLDKPLGMTSAHAVARVKRILLHAPPLGGDQRGISSPWKGEGLKASGYRKKEKLKIGHAGTLDPLATGVLPLALGEATKTVQYAMDGRKTYRFTARWGEARTTDDAEGEITATSPVRPSKEAIEGILSRFRGTVLQTPPAYSAIKVRGERAYALARAGEAVALEVRSVHIERLELTAYSPEEAIFELSCGKGTYVRSLARDLARALGTVGHVAALRRMAVGGFTERDAISLERLEEMVHKGTLARVLQPVESVLDDIPAREVTSAAAQCLRHGQAVSLPAGESASIPPLIRAHAEGMLVALCSVGQGMMKPVRVFNM